MRTACVFVDGENFRRSIGDLFPTDFDRNEYLPKRAKWGEFFDWLVGKACTQSAERLRTYWYVIEQVDFYPYRLPRADRETDTLHKVLSKNRSFRDELGGLDSEARLCKMNEMVDQLKKTQQTFENRFKGWRVIQDGIAIHHRAVEFRRAGAIRYDLFTRNLGDEKAVDVMLATDLIMLRDIYDVAVIVSGDQDFVPAVRAVKDAGKSVVNVAFRTQNGRLLPGGARRLNEITDSSFELAHDNFKEFLGLAG